MIEEEAKEEHPGMPVSKLCDLFGVSRSWYYEKPNSDEKASEGVELRDAIERIVLELPGYGYRRVTETLKRQGWCINRKKVLRVMRKESLLCQLKRHFKPTTDSSHSLKTYPNLIKDAAVDAPDQRHGRRTSPTSDCPRASVTWPRYLTSTLATA
jgi:transposase InsO family protein